MKNLLFILVLSVCFQGFSRDRISCVTKHDGRLGFWYDRIWVDPAPSLVCGEGIMLNCYDPGWERCRLTNAGEIGLDPTDIYAINELVRLSELNADNFNLSGTISIQVQAPNESNPRIYSADWNLDKYNNGDIEIYRE